MTEGTNMRAKVRVGSVTPVVIHEGKVTQERVTFFGVAKTDGYGPDGSDENNTFAKFSPSVLIDMQIQNPDLIGKHQPGDTFYVDFSPAPK